MTPEIVAVVGVCVTVTIAIVFVVTVVVHNGLIVRRSLCDQAWSDIQHQVELRRSLVADLATATGAGGAVDEAKIEVLRFAIASADVALERARYRYNAAARAFNDGVRGLPGRLVARLVGHRQYGLVEVRARAGAWA